jgi:hypothetical protein
MNKELMKRKHMEESNVILQNRLNNKTAQPVFSGNVEKSNQRKDLLKDKLINQLKGK